MIAAAALSVVLAQATPAVTSSPSPQKPTLVRVASGAISIPATWQAAPGSVTATTHQGVIGAWMSSAAGGETLVLFAVPRNGASLDDIVKRMQAEIARSAPGTALKSNASQMFCHGTVGRKLIYSDSTGTGETLMIAATRARAYILDYQYPGYPGVSADGEAAAESLCPPADPLVRLPPPPISIPTGWALQDPTSFGLPEGTTEWVWLPPAGSTQGLEVNAVPRAAIYGLGPYASLIMILHTYDRESVQKAFMALRVVSNEPMRICKRYDGSYRRLVMLAKGQRVFLDWVTAVTDSTRYSAIYWHYAAIAADPHAVQAIRSLCPRS